MKKIRMLRDYNWQKAGWVGEVFDAVAEQWVADGIAETFEDKAVVVERAVETPRVETAAVTTKPRKPHRR